MRARLASLAAWCEGTALESWCQSLPELCSQRLQQHGDWPKWAQALSSLPAVKPTSVDLCCSAVTIGSADDLSPKQHESLLSALKALVPWRKGPFALFGNSIDTEWRSDWKWNRLLPHISPLNGRAVLDIGCGNGYYLARMSGERAAMALGVDPTVLFSAQYEAWRQYVPNTNLHLLPLGIEDLPENAPVFDTVFSMGVLYHRRSPMDHLLHLRRLLKPGGELVLETLVVPGDETTVLVPSHRYAGMRNVWFIASASATRHWLRRCAFVDVTLVDETLTSPEEQRTTAWMPFHSLAQTLEGDRTVEGYPPPTRAIFVARTKRG